MNLYVRSPDQRPIVAFEGLNPLFSKWSFRVLGTRCPNPGEFFLNGVVPMAYKAKHHLMTPYQIVEPVGEYKLWRVWVRQ